MTHNIIATLNFQYLQAVFKPIVKGKRIMGLDMETSLEPCYTDKILIYLEADSSVPERGLFVWKIYGFREKEEDEVILCSEIQMCYGNPSSPAELPDKYIFDRKQDSPYCSEEEIERMANNPRIGFKNAIGRTITDVDYQVRYDRPTIIVSCPVNINIHSYGFDICYDDDAYAEENRFTLHVALH